MNDVYNLTEISRIHVKFCESRSFVLESIPIIRVQASILKAYADFLTALGSIIEVFEKK